MQVCGKLLYRYKITLKLLATFKGDSTATSLVLRKEKLFVKSLINISFNLVTKFGKETLKTCNQLNPAKINILKIYRNNFVSLFTKF